MGTAANPLHFTRSSVRLSSTGTVMVKRIGWYNLRSGRSQERLAALSDGVFAFAMTLLLTDIHFPKLARCTVRPSSSVLWPHCCHACWCT